MIGVLEPIPALLRSKVTWGDIQPSCSFAPCRVLTSHAFELCWSPTQSGAAKHSPDVQIFRRKWVKLGPESSSAKSSVTKMSGVPLPRHSIGWSPPQSLWLSQGCVIERILTRFGFTPNFWNAGQLFLSWKAAMMHKEMCLRLKQTVVYEALRVENVWLINWLQPIFFIFHWIPHPELWVFSEAII